MSMCRRHDLFEPCPECNREMRQEREYFERLRSPVERNGIASNENDRGVAK